MIDYSLRAEEAMARYKAFIEQCRDLFVIGADLPALKTRTKGEHSPTQTLIRRCLKAGLIFSDHRGSATRYFLNFEDMEIARKKFDAAVVEHKRAKRALRNKTRRVVSKSAPAMPVTYVKRVTAAGAAFKAQTAYRPAHVKVQRCPAGIDQRFTPCEPFPKIFSSMRIGTYL